MSGIDFIRRQILRYRDLLANLSRRNKELYYRENRGHCINLSKSPDIDDKLNIPISEKFIPLRATSPTFQTLLDESTFDLNKHFYLNETNNQELIKRLEKTRIADHNFQREYGISGAWLLGPFLCWRDKASYKPEDILISPIFKIAVDVSKNRLKQWSLKLEDNTPELNPSLRVALRQKWGIQLPEQLESEHAEAAITEIKRYIENAGKTLAIDINSFETTPQIPPRFKLIRDEQGEISDRVPINLEETLSKKDYELYKKVTHSQFILIDVVLVDLLNASRTVLLRDYDSILEKTDMHPILSELFLGKPIPGERNAGHEQIKLLDSYREKENYFVVNADSSQHRAIDQASKNRSVVIQGPPGTGKSQTITNLIAGAIAKEKKILFVSEKRAALDVVFSRLQEANVASQTVLIHSSDLNKQKLYNTFLELSDSIPDSDADQHWEQVADEFDTLKLELNKYYQILETKHESSGLTTSDLLTRVADNQDDKIDINLAKTFSTYTFVELQKICALLDELQIKIKNIGQFETHPWLFRKKDTILTSSFSQLITELIEKIKLSEKTVKALEKNLTNLGVSQLDSIPPLNALEKIVNFNVPPEWIGFCNVFYSDPDIFPSYVKKINSIIKTIQDESFDYSKITQNVDIEIIKQLETYYSIKRNFMDWYSPIFWKMRNYRRQCLTTTWDGTNRAFKAYRLIHESIHCFKTIEQNTLLPDSVSENNPNSILEIYAVLVPLVKFALELGATMKKMGLKKNKGFLKYTVESSEEIKKYFLSLSQAKFSLDKEMVILKKEKTELCDYFENPPNLEKVENNLLLYDSLLQTIKDLILLDQIDLCFEELQKLLSTELTKQKFIEIFIPINSAWGSHVLSSVTRWWVDGLLIKHPELRNFDRDNFHKHIGEFKTLENKHRLLARAFVNNIFSKTWNDGAGEDEGLNLLKKEANKHRKVAPPRELMERGAISTMMKLKPCWLMSPLSISQVLPLTYGLFDVVVFDEASQVRVEDAIPSIYRAKSMIVVGDPKQMPPTNFFAVNEPNDNDDDEENADEAELTSSILDLAAQIYPTEILEWHYRSRSEALIAFSNRAFYGGRLIAAPNPYFITEGDIIKFHQITNSYFNQKNGNVVEAEAIVDRLFELLETMPNKSFGIIAMGQSQMLVIEEAIERKQLSDEKFRHLIEQSKNYSEDGADCGFFVKNLENVQGDERDVILLSVSYAPSSPNKKLYMNFGPLSKQGGGRRLNVAITRAKQKIEIFCSFDPNEIATNEQDFEKNPDLVVFGKYLKYAKAIHQKKYVEAQTILESFGISGAITTHKSSNFSKDVQRRLEELGHNVSAEIGSSGFYIDLAIHHPVIPSNFILGIECDGALYHSTPYARDRDKIRQELLESRGWKITRIWSQDWSKNWKNELGKLDNLIKQILHEEKSQKN